MTSAFSPPIDLTTLLTFIILFFALAISASTSVKQMVTLYQWQAWVLAVVVFLTASEGDRFNFVLASVTILPIFLALTIKPLLGRATLAGPGQSNWTKLPGWSDLESNLKTFWAIWVSLREAVSQTELIWLQHGRSWRAGFSIAVDLILTVMAFMVAYRLGGTGSTGTIDTNSLAVSLALLLVGLFTMSNKRDIIAQIMGLLVMEHGLFLAAVRSFAISTLPFVFAVSLFFYVIITLTILLWLLPALHRISGSIELDDQKQLKG